MLSQAGRAMLSPAFTSVPFRVLSQSSGNTSDSHNCSTSLPELPPAVTSFRAPEHQTPCVVRNQNQAGMFFTASAVLNPTQTSYANYEYRQYLRGYFCYRVAPNPVWEPVPLSLRGNAVLSPTEFREDGFPNGKAYGHRDDNLTCCGDDFGPKGYTRKTGWLYTMEDFPSLRARSGVEYQIKLDFCLELVDASAESPKTVSRGQSSVRCCGILPDAAGCDLPDAPPCPLFWLPSGQGEGPQLIVTEPKAMGDYWARIFIERQTSQTIVRATVIKPNGAPQIPLSLFHLQLVDVNGNPVPEIKATDARLASESTGLVIETSSASTTAQAQFVFSSGPEIRSAELTIPDHSVLFEPDDLNSQ